MACSPSGPARSARRAPHAPATAAQNAARVPATLSRPTSRFGRTLNLPKDGKDLYIADEDYIRFPLPPGEQAYAGVDAKSIKATIGEITAISRKSRDDGNQYWGRIPGTPYDRMMQDWVMNRFKGLGMQEVRRREIAMKPLWFPTAWAAELRPAAGVALKSAFPIAGDRRADQGTRVGAGGLGPGLEHRRRFPAARERRPARRCDDLFDRDARRAFRSHRRLGEARSSAPTMRRRHAIIMVGMGFPGRHSQVEAEAPVGARAPTITITPDDANLIRDQLDARNVEVEASSQARHRGAYEGSQDRQCLGRAAGRERRRVLIMAHTDAWLRRRHGQRVRDRHDAGHPLRGITAPCPLVSTWQRPRTLVFLTTSDHHRGSVGIRWVRDNLRLGAELALIVNSEQHPSQTLLYNLYDAGLMTSNG